MSDSNGKVISPDTIMDVLQLLFPVKGLLYVGAGRGQASGAIQDWKAENALLVDANPEYRDLLEQFVRTRDGWLTETRLLGEEETEKAFYHVSNPLESGIIPADVLTELWPNLVEEGNERIRQTTLDLLLAEPGYRDIAANINTVVMDCLPALPVLKGASQQIQHWETLRLRVVLAEQPQLIEEAHLEEICDYLVPLGFSCLDVTEGNHPAIGEALFYRDWKNTLSPVIEKITRAGDEQEQLAKEKERQIQALRQQYTQQGTRLSEIKDRNQILTREGELLSNRIQEIEKTAQDLTIERDRLKQLLEDKDLQLKQSKQDIAGQISKNEEKDRIIRELTAERDRQTADIRKLEGKLDQATQENRRSASIIEEKQELVRELSSERDRQTADIRKLEEQLEQVTQEHRRNVLEFEKEQNRARELTSEREGMEKLLAVKDEKIQELAKAADEKEKENNTKTQEVARLTELTENQKREMQRLKDETEALQETLKKLKIQQEEYVSELEARRTESRQYLEKIQQAEKKTSELEDICNNQANIIRQANEKLERVTSEKNAESHKLRLLDEEIVKSRSQLDFIKGIMFDGKR